ncbi:MAG: hypothetical protein IKF90_07215 [Parasporobacterium sp.]|nr:hypothetical protein [Parasporobacterium sp.]
MSSRESHTKRNTSDPRLRRHVSGNRSAGSVRQRQGIDFRERRAQNSGGDPVERVFRSSASDYSRPQQRAAATQRRTTTPSGRSRSRSGKVQQGRSRRRTSSGYVRQASQSQRRAGAHEAATRRNAYYLRRQRRIRQLRIRFVVLAVLIVLLTFLILQIFPVLPSAEVEAGTVINPRDFLRFTFMSATFPGGKADYDKNSPGTYDIKVRSGLFNHNVELTVVDTHPPVVETKDVSVGIGGDYKPEDFCASIEDATKTTVSFVTPPDDSLIDQTQEVNLVITDAGGNETQATSHLTILPIAAKLQVELGTGIPEIYSFMTDVEEPDDNNYIITDLNKIDFTKPGTYDVEYCWRGNKYSAKMTVEDTTPPVFQVAEDFTSYLGDSIRYKEHVTVVDNSGTYELEVDNSAVDPEKLGTYDVIYTATDPYRHSSSATVKLTIEEKSVDEALLFQKADEILAGIITDGMTDKDKVTAIYRYCLSNFSFINDSEKGDYVKAALTMLDIRKGDCYSFFALAKVLLDRAGIKNMDIYTKNDYAEHYWNLVDIGDGHGWYHFDCTPNLFGVDIIFALEADLKPLNTDGRYDYDHSKFPPVA